MEEKVSYIIHQLSKESVIIEHNVTGIWNGKEITLEKSRTDYPNTDFGREALFKDVQEQKFIDAILLIFGDAIKVEEESLNG